MARYDALQDCLTQVELHLSDEFQAKRLDNAAYVDAAGALADAGLALVRAETPAAERPIAAALAAADRFERRGSGSGRVRAMVRTAVEAAAYSARGADPERASRLILQLQSLRPPARNAPVAVEAIRATFGRPAFAAR
jgi:hypothetical protein